MTSSTRQPAKTGPDRERVGGRRRRRRGRSARQVRGRGGRGARAAAEGRRGAGGVAGCDRPLRPPVSSSVVRPMRTSRPARASAARSRRAPLTNVPLADPRSSIDEPTRLAGHAGVRRESSGSSPSRPSPLSARPITNSSSSVSRWPLARPSTTTSSSGIGTRVTAGEATWVGSGMCPSASVTASSVCPEAQDVAQLERAHALEPLAVHEGPVRRAQVLDGQLALRPAREPRVTARELGVVAEPPVGLGGRAPDQQLAVDARTACPRVVALDDAQLLAGHWGRTLRLTRAAAASRRLWLMPACPSCGEDTPEGARFCPVCGMRAGRAGPRRRRSARS